MGLFDFFSGGSPEKYEQKADNYVISGTYGHAKLAYEKALDRLDRQGAQNPGYRQLLEDKLGRCKESLAREHRENGKNLVAAGCEGEARELFLLARELTRDTRLAADIASRLEHLSATAGQMDAVEFFEAEQPAETVDDADESGSDDEYFTALCNALEEPEREAYRSYPDTFRQGFIALNRGDFEAAVRLLSEAGQAYPFAANYITLELATAYLNLGDSRQAQSLLAHFLQEQPDSLKANFLLCDIFWENNEFEAARALLSSCPATIADSLPVKMLVGETLMRSNAFSQAADFFRELLETHGWEPLIAQSLAGAYEALGRSDLARNLYGEIMGSCTGCGTRVDPLVKQRYAETSLKSGDFSTRILELYFDLVREDPDNRLNYYHTISRIYSLQGNENESTRFAAIARQVAREEK